MSTQANKVFTSKIKDYKRDKKTLTPPFGQLKMIQVMWHKDMLPDFLWIDSLIAFYGEMGAPIYYNHLLDVLDKYHSGEPILTGMISEFSLIPEKDREEIISKNKFLIEDTIINPFSHIIRLYPECPMSWLLDGADLTPQDNGDAIEDAKRAVKRLFPAKDSHGGFVRALPLSRFFKHNKVFITSKLTELVKSIEEYPNGDRHHAESFARTTHNMYYGQERSKNPDLAKWSEYFWKINYTISKCET